MTLRFGTDGVRAEAITVLTAEYARALGAAVVNVLDAEQVIIGRDTRESGPVLQQAFAEGCAAAGASIIDLGVAPTPAVAWMSKSRDVPAAVLSASHNPWQDNGIKVFEAGGTKISDRHQDEIQAILDAGEGVLVPAEVAVTEESVDGYVDAVIDAMGDRSLAGAAVVLDCAHGAAFRTAPEIFERLGASVTTIGVEPTGTNINEGVGSTYPDTVRELVLEHDADVGFAFDGDADRVIACGRDGTLIDGDRIIAMSAIDRHDQQTLPHDTVVITVMTNLGFRHAMAKHDIDIVETPVGDRHVLAALDAGGFLLGGEQSGHIIHRDLATTGDGVLSAVLLLDAARRRDTDVGTWAANVMERFPQVLENVAVAHPIENLHERLADAVQAEEALLGDSGRVLVRASGTEPLVRVMVEAADSETANQVASRLAQAVRRMVSS